MKTKYKYIHFEHRSSELYTNDNIWTCRNNKSNSLLGMIEYYPSWRQHVISFEKGCVFNNTCLQDIIHFLEQLNKQPPEAE